MLPLQAKELVIKAKGYLDVASGKIISGKYIYVKDTKIIQISNSLDSKNKDIVDLGNYYLMPGLIDSHSHIFMTQTLLDKEFETALLREALLSDEVRSERAKKFLSQYLHEGFTTLFDLGNSGEFLDSKLRDEISGSRDYPMLLVSGPGIATSHGQFSSNSAMKYVVREYAIVDSQTNINKLLETYLKNKIDILKIYLDNSPGLGVLDERILKKILLNKRISYFKKITFHSLTREGAAIVNKYRIKNLEHYNYFNSSFAMSSVKFVTPTDLSKDTLLKFNYYSPSAYLAQKNKTHFLSKTNIEILFGPDFYFHTIDAGFNRAQYVIKSIEAFEDSGLSPIEIIRSLTLNPAKSVGLKDQIGQIKIGAMANIIATRENPLQSARSLYNLPFIMNKGKIVLDIKNRN
jgi:imidazolonepropionase-like amidohydrolase